MGETVEAGLWNPERSRHHKKKILSNNPGSQELTETKPTTGELAWD